MNHRLDVLITNHRVADVRQTTLENLTRFISADNPPTLTATAQGGYATAQLNLTMSEVDAWRMLSQRLGCRLVVTSPLAANTDMICWEGMIYTITVDSGKNEVSRTLTDLVNRVRVVYSIITFDGSGNPVFGEQATTADTDDAASQALYGIRELNYIVGGAAAADAEQLRATLLSQYQLALAQSLGAQRGGGGEASNLHVTLDCVGWWESLDKRIFTQTAVTALANIDVSVKACLTGVGQFVSSDQSGIGANAYQTTRYADGNLTAQGYLNKLCALGGANARRYYLGLYEQGRPYYSEEPATVAYRAHRLDPTEAIYDAVTGAVVPPWLVRPGRLISFDDLVPDALTYSAALANARTMLIGETRFTAPNLLELVPQTSDPSQLNLTRMGLAGN